MSFLEVRNLCVEFSTPRGKFRAVDGVDITVDEGEVLCIVGESGSGKSVSMLAVMGLLGPTSRVSADVLRVGNADLRKVSTRERRRLLGSDIAMIFQDPMSSLNPCYSIESQISEVLRIHDLVPRSRRRDRVVELLTMVGIPAPEKRLKSYPHEMSGGMNQRVMIAMALAANPRLLIADEPTTALDVTIQRQILSLIGNLQREHRMGLVLITHDMGVVAEMADQVQVMYAGQVVEVQGAREIFRSPRHPYTAALLGSMPENAVAKRRLPTIPGTVPGITDRPAGCVFNPRCSYAASECREVRPELVRGSPHTVRCHFPLAAKHPELEEPVQ